MGVSITFVRFFRHGGVFVFLAGDRSVGYSAGRPILFFLTGNVNEHTIAMFFFPPLVLYSCYLPLYGVFGRKRGVCGPQGQRLIGHTHAAQYEPQRQQHRNQHLQQQRQQRPRLLCERRGGLRAFHARPQEQRRQQSQARCYHPE